MSVGPYYKLRFQSSAARMASVIAVQPRQAARRVADDVRRAPAPALSTRSTAASMAVGLSRTGSRE